jgi:hypothetical protein
MTPASGERRERERKREDEAEESPHHHLLQLYRPQASLRLAKIEEGKRKEE